MSSATEKTFPPPKKKIQRKRSESTAGAERADLTAPADVKKINKASGSHKFLPRLCSLPQTGFDFMNHRSLLEGSASRIPRAAASRSYTGGEIHFNIYLHEYIFQKSQNVQQRRRRRRRLGGGKLGGRSSEREIVHSGKKNHCVTPGEKYCCFA